MPDRNRPEPVRLSVSDVRRAIYRTAGYAGGEGQPSTDALGSLFHRVFRALMDPASECGWANVLDPENLAGYDRLRDQVYAVVVGPKLRENEATLQRDSRQVLTMWDAVGHLCKHVCQLLVNSREQGLLRYDAAKHAWSGAEQFSMEEELTWLVEDASWTAPVLVSGIVDAVWRNPASKRWCVLEVKLGAGAAEADLAQVCLYHEMLRSKMPAGSGPVSLWHFQPELKHTQYTETQLEPVLPHLRALIGRLAGVTGGVTSGESGEAQPARAAEPLYRELGERLVQVLQQFGPMVTLDSDPVVGPAFLRFHIMPGPGVKVEKILGLGKNLGVQLRLARPALICVDEGMLVVDLQRPDRETLYFSEFVPLLPRLTQTGRGNARMLVGVDLKRQPRYADLESECPHILAAGTTGSGKSEWLRMALASLLATNTPRTLRVMLIDPKRVTFGELRGSAFLLDGVAPLYTPEEAIGGLHRLIHLMEERYALFAKHGCADLQQLNAQMTLPRIVCFCDEYGNLVATKKNRDAIEMAINQLGAKARAAGIHLVIATQDPRAQILSPTLKTNLLGRVCLRTTSANQSRMMLEESGAESLLGYGDLLYKTIGEPSRLQAPLLDGAEKARLFQ